jgi:argininosuccinate synthase
LEKKAKASGASQLVVKDLREEFVRDYVFPCLRAGAVYERKYLLGTSMARPVIAKVSSYLEVCYIVGVFTYSKHVDLKEY